MATSTRTVLYAGSLRSSDMTIADAFLVNTNDCTTLHIAPAQPRHVALNPAVCPFANMVYRALLLACMAYGQHLSDWWGRPNAFGHKLCMAIVAAGLLALKRPNVAKSGTDVSPTGACHGLTRR